MMERFNPPDYRFKKTDPRWRRMDSGAGLLGSAT
jgi:hypothetical protein